MQQIKVFCTRTVGFGAGRCSADAEGGLPEVTAGTIQSLENAIRHLPDRIRDAETDLDVLKRKAESMLGELDKPWPQQAQFDALVAEQAELVKALGLDKDDESANAAEGDIEADTEAEESADEGEEEGEKDGEEEVSAPSRQLEFEADEAPGHNPLEHTVKRPRRAVNEYRRAHELIEDADAALWTPEGQHATLLLNKPAAEILRTLMGGPAFHGVFLPRTEATDLAADVESQSKLIQYANFPGAQHSMRRLAQALRTAAQNGDVTAVVAQDRSHAAVMRTLRHERFHLFQNGIGEGITTRAGVAFLANALARRGADAIARRTSLPADELWHEVPAYIASGQWESLGYTKEEALKVFQHYLANLQQEHGDKSVDAALKAADPIIRSEFDGVQLRSERPIAPGSGREALPAERGGEIQEGSPEETSGAQGGTGPSSRAGARTEAGEERVTSEFRFDDPLHFTSAAIHGAQLLAAGIRRVKEWNLRMVAEFGEKIKPHLFRLYAEAKKLSKDESGVLDLAKLVELYRGSALKDAIDLVRPAGSRIRAEGGGAGARLMERVQRAGDEGEVLAGHMLVRLANSGLSKLNQAERFELLDLLEGRKQQPSTPSLQQVFGVARSVLDEIAAGAMALGVQRSTGKGSARVPFSAMGDWFPHFLRPADALGGGVGRDIVANMVRTGVRPDEASAQQFLDEWRRFLRGGQPAPAAPVSQPFTVTATAQATFVISGSPEPAALRVYRNGVRMAEANGDFSYDAAAKTITFQGVQVPRQGDFVLVEW